MTGATQTFRLPFPPSLHALYVHRPQGGRAKSRAYARWLKEAGWTLIEQRVQPHKLPVRLALTFTPPDRRRRDLGDNYHKPVLDLLVAHRILPDDSSRHVLGVDSHWTDGPAAGVEVAITSQMTFA